MAHKIIEYAKLLRIPGLGGLAIPPVFGAISVGVYDLYSLSILFIVGALSAIFGFVLNDYADIELDGLITELKNKPLVKGAISKKSAVIICFFAMLSTFFFAFFLWIDVVLNSHRFLAIGCLVVAGVLGSIYNLYGKNIFASDFLVATSMSLVFLYGALAFSDDLGILPWSIFFLTFNQTLHMNAVEGGLKDADHDYLMGVTNIALRSGVKVEKKKIVTPWFFKAFGLGIRIFSSILVFLPFLLGLDFEIWQITLLILLLFGVFYNELRLLFLKVFDRSKIRKYIALSNFLRYSIVPIMLISVIGVLGGIVLATLPILWYIVFSPLLGTKLFQPEM